MSAGLASRMNALAITPIINELSTFQPQNPTKTTLIDDVLYPKELAQIITDYATPNMQRLFFEMLTVEARGETVSAKLQARILQATRGVSVLTLSNANLSFRFLSHGSNKSAAAKTIVVLQKYFPTLQLIRVP